MISFFDIFWKSFSEEECVKKKEYDVIAKVFMDEPSFFIE